MCKQEERDGSFLQTIPTVCSRETEGEMLSLQTSPKDRSDAMHMPHGCRVTLPGMPRVWYCLVSSHLQVNLIFLCSWAEPDNLFIV